MPAYLITGPNGSGKSTVGKMLAECGYEVIEMDAEPGLSAWVDNSTGKVVTEFPSHPFSEQWLAAHAWVWLKDRFLQILQTSEGKTIFFCGGAYNQKDFYDLFTDRFTLYLDDAATTQRLRLREPARWQDGSPELIKTLAWNAKSKQISTLQGSRVIDGARPTKNIVDEILACL